MPSLEFFLVAEDASADQTTNRLSLYNVFEAFQTPGFPLLISKCCAVAVWRKQPEDEGRDFQCILRLTLPDGQIHQLETNFRMPNATYADRCVGRRGVGR